MQKAIRVTVLVLVIGFLISLMVYNSLNPSKEEFTPWNENMTLGDKETAKYHYIMYTDISCPFCNKFSRAVATHDEEFKSEYIEGQNIYFEIRLTDMNYENGHSDNSRPAAEGAYCAARQGKFWEYYHELLNQFYDDFNSKGIGVDRTSKPIPTQETEYYYRAARHAGVDQDAFASCFENHETAEELDKNTKLAYSKTGGGIPHFVFNNNPMDGFAGTFDAEADWLQAKLMLDSGLTGQN